MRPATLQVKMPHGHEDRGDDDGGEEAKKDVSVLANLGKQKVHHGAILWK